MENHVNLATLQLIKTSEGCVLYPYDDLVPPKNGKYPEWKGGPLRGTATIGIGHTNAARHPLKVVPGLRITEQEALDILDVDLGEAAEAVQKNVKVPLNNNQFGALVSFTYNCGAGNLKKLVRELNTGNYDSIPAKLMLYTKSKGVQLRGLVNRRRAETALWRSMPEDAQTSAALAAPDSIPETVDKAPQSKEDLAAKLVTAGATAQAAASVTGSAKDVKDNVGGLDIFGTIDHLVLRPSFWIAVAFIVAVCWWRRWPSFIWRRFA